MPYPVSAARGHWTGASAAGNWWEVAGQTCVAAYCPKGAADYAASKGNLANPGTWTAADGAAYPTWAAETGWTFNGTTQYLTTTNGILHGLSAFSVLMRCNITSGAKRGLFSNGSGTVTDDTVFLESDRQFVRDASVGSTSLTYSWPTNQNAVACVTYSATAWTVYSQGSSVASGAGYGTLSTSTLATWLVGVSAGTGAAIKYMAGTVQAMAVYAGELSPAQVAALTTAMNAL